MKALKTHLTRKITLPVWGIYYAALCALLYLYLPVWLAAGIVVVSIALSISIDERRAKLARRESAAHLQGTYEN